MAQAAFGGVSVLQGIGSLDGNISHEGATEGGVHGMHAMVDSQDGNTQFSASDSAFLHVLDFGGTGIVTSENNAGHVLKDVFPGTIGSLFA